MASAADDADGPITSINVTPLVDIILVVLIIFMATAPLIQRRAMQVDVPKAAHHTGAASEALQVLLKEDGTLLVAGKPMGREQLSNALKAAVNKEPGMRVTFAADKKIDYAEVISTLDVIRGAGVRKIGLEVSRK